MDKKTELTRDAYQLPAPAGLAAQMSRKWLYFAIASLLMGGVLPVLIVAARVPGLYDYVPLGDFFRTAIVIHVDLTVLAWFLGFAGVLWSLNSQPRGATLGWLALGCTVAGTLIFSFAPFAGGFEPFMNNYVPVLQNKVFFAGLALFGVGYGLLVLRSLVFSQPIGGLDSGAGALRVGLLTAAIASVVALLSVFAAYVTIPAEVTGQHYYELLFWGGGHVLQFTHTQLLLVVWLWLATVTQVSLCIAPRIMVILLVVGVLPVLAAPMIYAAYEINTAEHRLLMTQLMQYGNGLAVIPVGLLIVWALVRSGKVSKELAPVKVALVMSILLFATGGIVGYLISGINVTIPAHYHGSIVGVVLAYMGMTYYLLPKMGFAPPQPRLARIQPMVYGGGQLIHVFGLAWSGGYGVQRKTAGAEQAIETVGAKIGMQIVGIGTVIALIGGLLFAIVVIRSIVKGRKATADATTS